MKHEVAITAENSSSQTLMTISGAEEPEGAEPWQPQINANDKNLIVPGAPGTVSTLVANGTSRQTAKLDSWRRSPRESIMPHAHAINELSTPHAIWDAQKWLSAWDELIRRGCVRDLPDLLACVRSTTSEALLKNCYYWRGPPNLKGKEEVRKVNLGPNQANIDKIAWFGCSNVSVPRGGEKSEVAPPVIVTDMPPLEIVMKMREIEGPARPIKCVVETIEFDAEGKVDLARCTTPMQQNLAFRSDFGRFIAEAGSGPMRHGKATIRQHLTAHRDPYVFTCPSVRLFRGARNEGYPFLPEPVNMDAIVSSSSKTRPIIRVLSNDYGERTEWYADDEDHTALLERLNLIGLVALQDVNEDTPESDAPILVLNAIGCTKGGRHPRDAFAVSMKHWRRRFGSYFHTVFLSCSSVVGENLDLASDFDSIINRQVYRMGESATHATRGLKWHWDSRHLALSVGAANLKALSAMFKRRGEALQQRLNNCMALSGCGDTERRQSCRVGSKAVVSSGGAARSASASPFLSPNQDENENFDGKQVPRLEIPIQDENQKLDRKQVLRKEIRQSLQISRPGSSFRSFIKQAAQGQDASSQKSSSSAASGDSGSEEFDPDEDEEKKTSLASGVRRSILATMGKKDGDCRAALSPSPAPGGMKVWQKRDSGVGPMVSGKRLSMSPSTLSASAVGDDDEDDENRLAVHMPQMGHRLSVPGYIAAPTNGNTTISQDLRRNTVSDCVSLKTPRRHSSESGHGVGRQSSESSLGNNAISAPLITLIGVPPEGPPSESVSSPCDAIDNEDLQATPHDGEVPSLPAHIDLSVERGSRANDEKVSRAKQAREVLVADPTQKCWQTSSRQSGSAAPDIVSGHVAISLDRGVSKDPGFDSTSEDIRRHYRDRLRQRRSSEPEQDAQSSHGPHSKSSEHVTPHQTSDSGLSTDTEATDAEPNLDAIGDPRSPGRIDIEREAHKIAGGRRKSGSDLPEIQSVQDASRRNSWGGEAEGSGAGPHSHSHRRNPRGGFEARTAAEQDIDHLAVSVSGKLQSARARRNSGGGVAGRGSGGAPLGGVSSRRGSVGARPGRREERDGPRRDTAERSQTAPVEEGEPNHGSEVYCAAKYKSSPAAGVASLPATTGERRDTRKTFTTINPMGINASATAAIVRRERESIKQERHRSELHNILDGVGDLVNTKFDSSMEAEGSQRKVTRGSEASDIEEPTNIQPARGSVSASLEHNELACAKKFSSNKKISSSGFGSNRPDIWPNEDGEEETDGYWQPPPSQTTLSLDEQNRTGRRTSQIAALGLREFYF
ncbi:MAG: hypothetical protein CMC97_06195 [Flavobacteriales bacterium]|nr:hypothetical protein [Flavobacteriales bacterium]